MSIHPFTFVLFSCCCAAFGAAAASWYFRFRVIPRVRTVARAVGRAELTMDVARSARQWVQGDAVKIAAECRGGPLDGMFFHHPVKSTLAQWTGPAGEDLGTYCMTFDRSGRGRWLFEHVAPQAGVQTP